MFTSLQSFVWLPLAICFAGAFSPDRLDYDAYGSKVTANNLMIVQADNQYFEFYFVFGNFTDNSTAAAHRSCAISYAHLSVGFHRLGAYKTLYIYTVAVGKSPSAALDIFFIGERTDLDESIFQVNRTFVGVISYAGSPTEIDCDYIAFPASIQFIRNVPHQEHLVLVTDPFSTVAYGFSNLFTFSYVASTNKLAVHLNSSLSFPTPFLPFAGDYDGHRGIIAGLLGRNQSGRMYIEVDHYFRRQKSRQSATF